MFAELKVHCAKDGAVKGFLFIAWSRSEYSFTGFICCQEFCISNFCLPDAFSCLGGCFLCSVKR